MSAYANKALLGPLTKKQWENWLSKHPDDANGVRLLIVRKEDQQVKNSKHVNYAAALDVALCYGWIDSRGKPHDEHYAERCFTPRRRNSNWSQVNIAHVARLTEAGRMREAGLREVERAKQDGRWDAAYRQKGMEPDAKFQAALDDHPKAKAFWATLNKTHKFKFLFRLSNNKLEKTKAKNVALFIELLEQQRTL
ncbi:hypothetical protein CBOM_04029 [Ceraceosorus bombacis]|uniref:Bacteriocin-protection protein, YdeI/OmpD-associated family n=1 Tax=Ceraceosorus bombacis TaxID=401625 RepID=A0A0P1BML3_9BASI|nr:hypothetical protein CBOM_04029 [Ceraceosorus bombacis]